MNDKNVVAEVPVVSRFKVPITKSYDVKVVGDVIIVHSKFWHDCEHKIGKYMEESDYDIVVNDDMDFYAPSSNVHGDDDPEDLIMFKFRKDVFSKEEQLGAYEGLVGAATLTQNRGLAAGPRGATQGGRDWVTDEQLEIMNHFIHGGVSTLFEDDTDPIEKIRSKNRKKGDESRGQVWLRTKISDGGYNYKSFFNDITEEWKVMSREDASKEAELIKNTFISDTSYANAVLSGIAGFFDRYPRIPFGRATSYTEFNYDTYKKCYPFTTRLSEKFEELLPRRFAYQKEQADKLDEQFRVGGKRTVFTTITVNKNFRTACHRDAGDLNDGYSNLTVIAKDKDWEGGYLVLPEFRVAINIRPGDLLLVNNHAGIHGNTEMIPPEGKSIEDMERISLVMYFREKMLLLGTKDYEDSRRDYVDSRRLNKDHRLWKPLWNGISSNMWEEEEWYNFLRKNNKSEYLNKYHPKANEKQSTLEGFF